MMHRVLEGAGDELAREIDRQQLRLEIDRLVAGHGVSGVRIPTERHSLRNGCYSRASGTNGTVMRHSSFSTASLDGFTSRSTAHPLSDEAARYIPPEVGI